MTRNTTEIAIHAAPMMSRTWWMSWPRYTAATGTAAWLSAMRMFARWICDRPRKKPYAITCMQLPVSITGSGVTRLAYDASPNSRLAMGPGKKRNSSAVIPTVTAITTSAAPG